jgi:hypothetical protein
VIGELLMREREDAFGVQVVLPVALCPTSLAKAVVDLVAAAAAGMAEDPIEDLATVLASLKPRYWKSLRVRDGWEIE